MARRFATRIGAICANRFARIDSQKHPYFRNVRTIRENLFKPAILTFYCPEMRFAKKRGVQFGNPQAIRANRFARIDSQKHPCFRNIGTIRENLLKPAILTF